MGKNAVWTYAIRNCANYPLNNGQTLLVEFVSSMNPPQFKSRNIHKLAVAYVTAGLLLIELAAILLAIFEAAASTKLRHTSMASVHWHQYANLKFPDAQPWYQSTVSLCASRAE